MLGVFCELAFGTYLEKLYAPTVWVVLGVMGKVVIGGCRREGWKAWAVGLVMPVEDGPICAAAGTCPDSY